MIVETKPYDSAQYLNTPAEIAYYLELAMESGDPAELANALGVVARAKGISDLARETGLTRETLYSSLSVDGNPRLSTLTRIMKALGLKLSVQAM